TCRTQFFPTDDTVPKFTGTYVLGARVGGRRRTFYRLYMAPFTRSQVSAFLRRRFPWRLDLRRKARRLCAAIGNLTVRPMLLTQVPELVNKRPIPKTMWAMYETLVASWYAREDWLDNETLAALSLAIADDMFSNREQRGRESLRREEL